jgi:phenylacetate-CoA ligase
VPTRRPSSATKGFPQVARVQAVVTRSAHQDHLQYLVELAAGTPVEGLADRLTEAFREQLKVRGDVEIVPSGTIPAAAKKIDDRRVWK